MYKNDRIYIWNFVFDELFIKSLNCIAKNLSMAHHWLFKCTKKRNRQIIKVNSYVNTIINLIFVMSVFYRHKELFKSS